MSPELHKQHQTESAGRILDFVTCGCAVSPEQEPSRSRTGAKLERISEALTRNTRGKREHRTGTAWAGAPCPQEGRQRRTTECGILSFAHSADIGKHIRDKAIQRAQQAKGNMRHEMYLN